jgi:hypothetical protein
VSSGATLQAQQLPTACNAVSSTSSLHEKTYDSFESMHCALRMSGFSIKTRNFVLRNGAVTEQLRSIYWGCKSCPTKFTAYTCDGEEFRLIPKDHSDNCPCKPQSTTGPVGATVVKHTHELAAHQGLQQCIEMFGASSKHLATPPSHGCTTMTAIATITANTITTTSERGCTPTTTITTTPVPPPPRGCTTMTTITTHPCATRHPNCFIGIIRADQIADSIRVLFPGVTVVKELISRLARKAHDTMFGKGVSDVLLLRELGQHWEERGGSFSLVYGRDLGKIGLDAERLIGIVWIAPWAHFLVQEYGDLLGADGTHGISTYGWRAIPFSIMNSLDNPHPVMVVLATSENADIMCHATCLLHRHLVAHAVDYPPFAREVLQTPQVPTSDDAAHNLPDLLHEDYICPPEWRAFVHSVLQNLENHELPIVQMPSPNTMKAPTLLVDGGTGFDLYARRYALPKAECKLHLDSHNHIPAGELKYVRHAPTSFYYCGCTTTNTPNFILLLWVYNHEHTKLHFIIVGVQPRTHQTSFYYCGCTTT